MEIGKASQFPLGISSGKVIQYALRIEFGHALLLGREAMRAKPSVETDTGREVAADVVEVDDFFERLGAVMLDQTFDPGTGIGAIGDVADEDRLWHRCHVHDEVVNGPSGARRYDRGQLVGLQLLDGVDHSSSDREVVLRVAHRFRACVIIVGPPGTRSGSLVLHPPEGRLVPADTTGEATAEV